MRHGERVGGQADLGTTRAHAAAGLKTLPPHLRRLHGAPPIDVIVSDALWSLTARLDEAQV